MIDRSSNVPFNIASSLVATNSDRESMCRITSYFELQRYYWIRFSMQRGRLLVAMAKNTICYHQDKENDGLVLNSSPSLFPPVDTKYESATQRKDVGKEQSTLSIPSSSTVHPVLQEINVNSSLTMASNDKPIPECNQRKYYISPIHSDQSDFDDSDHGSHFFPNSQIKILCLLRGRQTKSPSSSSSRSSSSSSSDDRVENNLNRIAGTDGLATEPNISSEEQNSSTRGKKRVRNVEAWKHKVATRLRNTGRAYESVSKRQVPARKMGPTCGETCRLNCHLKINETSRQDTFNNFIIGI